MKKMMIFIMVVVVSLLMIGVNAYAGCVKSCTGKILIYYTYKEKGRETIRKEFVFAEYITAEGRYGGGCNTAVGRQKARRRACDEVKRIVENKYRGKARVQMAALCQKVPEAIKRKAEWFKIDYLKMRMQPQGCSHGPCVINISIRAASQAKFTCNGNNPVSYNQPAPPTSTPGRKEINTDRRGSDYRNFAIYPPLNCDECQRACMQDPRCRAWTYVKPGVGRTRARCWLKNSVPPSVRNTNCISGVK